MVKKLSQLYLETRRSLMATEDKDSAEFLARNLICHVTEKSNAQFVADRENYVSDAVCTQVMQGVERLLHGEPLAYVLGQWEFFGLTLAVTPDVLIPRDDTCAVVEVALETMLKKAQPLRILDLCTGSGCIGLALASRLPNSKVTLADISQNALAVAKKNVSNLGLTARVSCVRVDALQCPAAFLGKFDLIISNPPYITRSEMVELPRSVSEFEPHLALLGGEDGLDFYRSIIRNFKTALKSGGYLCLEHGMGQGAAVCEILQKESYTILARTRDYNNRERAVLAQYGMEE